MDKKINYSFPFFGPFIMKVKLSDEEVKKLKKLCSKNKKKDVRNTLAGHLDDEYSIDKHEYQKIVAPYLDAFREGHARFYTLQIKPLATTSVWVNYMKAGDYNPTHIHTGCEFSSVLYTSIPKSLKKEAKNHIANSSVPGSISFTAFINHSPSHFGSVKYFPEEGDFFIFPFDVNHEVFPFKSKGTRISIAANFVQRR